MQKCDRQAFQVKLLMKRGVCGISMALNKRKRNFASFWWISMMCKRSESA